MVALGGSTLPEKEAGTLGAPPPPKVLELAASKVVDAPLIQNP